MAIRTGKYKDMNSVEVYEDEILEYNPILGKLRFVEDFSRCTQREAGNEDKIVGYYAFYELLTGFSKGLYMTKQQVINHAKKYSQSYQKQRKDSPWFTNFHEMAKKTVLKRLLSKWAVLSVEMQQAIRDDQKIYDDNGHGEYLDNKPGPDPADPVNELAAKVSEEFMPSAGAPQDGTIPSAEAPQDGNKAAESKKAEKSTAKAGKAVKEAQNAKEEYAEFEAGFKEDDLPFA